MDGSATRVPDNMTRIMTRTTDNETRSTTRIVQANLNHTQAAQDLMTQWTLENNVELCAVQEPWSVTNKDYWHTSRNGLAGIYWNRSISNTPCRMIEKGEHMVAAEYKGFVLIRAILLRTLHEKHTRKC